MVHLTNRPLPPKGRCRPHRPVILDDVDRIDRDDVELREGEICVNNGSLIVRCLRRRNVHDRKDRDDRQHN